MQEAISFGVTILRSEWLTYAWENRFGVNFDANDPIVVERFDLKPFTGLSLALVNFKKKDEIDEITKLIADNSEHSAHHTNRSNRVHSQAAVWSNQLITNART